MVQCIEDSSLKKISNQINQRRSQISILYIKFPVLFCFFFHWKAIYENAYEGLQKYRESLELFLGYNLECQSLLSVFFQEKIIFDFFWQNGNIIFVTLIHIYRKYHISMYF